MKSLHRYIRAEVRHNLYLINGTNIYIYICMGEAISIAFLVLESGSCFFDVSEPNQDR